jgi:putative membrane protein
MPGIDPGQFSAHGRRLSSTGPSIRDEKDERVAALQATRRIAVFQRALIGGYLVLWGLLAIAPVSRSDWFLENLLVFALAAFLVTVRHRLRLGYFSAFCLFVFMTIHAIGAHYTYSQVPYDDWLAAATGLRLDEMFGFERNHFDRLEHFLHGLLLTFPIRAAIAQWTSARGQWSYLLAAGMVMLLSATYEILEWLVAEVVASDVGMAFLGIQGDIWDAQKDMGLAFIGAILSMGSAWLAARSRT